MISFARDIVILFRSRDIQCMGNLGVQLTDYTYMSNPEGDNLHSSHANLMHVIGHLAGKEEPRMPPGGPYWPEEKVDILESWLAEGCKP